MAEPSQLPTCGDPIPAGAVWHAEGIISSSPKFITEPAPSDAGTGAVAYQTVDFFGHGSNVQAASGNVVVTATCLFYAHSSPNLYGTPAPYPMPCTVVVDTGSRLYVARGTSRSGTFTARYAALNHSGSAQTVTVTSTRTAGGDMLTIKSS